MTWNIAFLAIGIVSLGVNLMQWTRSMIARGQIRSMKTSLLQLNEMCRDAEGKKDADKPDAMARFISDVAHAGRAMEHQVDIALGDLQLAPKIRPSWLRRVWRHIFPL